MIESFYDLGRVAYEAYCRRSGYRSVVNGRRFSDYNDLPRESKDAWAAAAYAVADKVQSEKANS